MPIIYKILIILIITCCFFAVVEVAKEEPAASIELPEEGMHLSIPVGHYTVFGEKFEVILLN